MSKCNTFCNPCLNNCNPVKRGATGPTGVGETSATGPTGPTGLGETGATGATGSTGEIFTYVASNRSRFYRCDWSFWWNITSDDIFQQWWNSFKLECTPLRITENFILRDSSTDSYKQSWHNIQHASIP